MSRYKPEKFNFSGMSERITFQTLNADGTYTDNITVWAHILKDGFTRSETDNFFKIMMREQSALNTLLSMGNRIKWKRMTFSIFSWKDPSVEDRGFIEVLVKQIPSTEIGGGYPGPTEGDFFKDVVSVYNMTTVEESDYGLKSYKYTYDFTTPNYIGIRCNFSPDRNRYLDDKNVDTEHDSLIVTFNIDAPIKTEDYIVSHVHGKFKVDMVVKTDENTLLAHVQRSEVQ
jgi:hypothetical protein